ncbi:hypothetical protein NE865_09114 [Phthorimaea operculella]|nr:hypothetical protein NE865_09114 [Phthorimaea operculella]
MNTAPLKPPDPPDPQNFMTPLSPNITESPPGSPPSDDTFANLYYIGTQSQEPNLNAPQVQVQIHREQEPMDYTVDNNRKRSNNVIEDGLVSANKKVASIAAQGSDILNTSQPIQSSQNSQYPCFSQLSQRFDESQPTSESPLSQPNQSSRNPTRQFYKDSDTGPFIVHIVQGELDQQLHPIIFGKFIFSLKIKHIKMGGIKKIGRNRLSIEFDNPLGANDFMKNTALAQSKFKCFIPSYNVTRLGVVKGIPTEFSEEDIIENIILPYGYNGKIIKARRLKHRKLDVATRTVSRLDSETVVLTFDGQKSPERVYFMHNSLLIDQYNFPVIQCYKCCRYGHTMVQCRSRARCFKCAEEHSGDTCGITTEKSKCVFCSAAHFATNKVCPEYIRQVNIKSTMGKEGISFQEAAKMFAPARKLYSSAAKTIIQPSLQSASLTSQKQTTKMKAVS